MEQIKQEPQSKKDKTAELIENLKVSEINNKNLAAAIDAKDKEIVQIKNQLIRLELELKNNKIAVDEDNSKDGEIANLTGKQETLKKELKETKTLLDENKGIVEKQKETLVNQENQLKKYVESLNAYIAGFRALMKNVQGGLELAVEYEAIISEKLK
jgi:chromosome segregation ATPase